MVMIVGLIGVPGAGKTSIAKYLETHHGFIHISFASCLKEIASELFSVPLSEFVENKESKYNKKYTNREILQRIGALCREIDEDVWIKKSEKTINTFSADSLIVIDDVRHPNELGFVLNNGLAINVVRNDLELTYSHKSDKMACNMHIDYPWIPTVRANKGELNGLYSDVESILRVRDVL